LELLGYDIVSYCIEFLVAILNDGLLLTEDDKKLLGMPEDPTPKDDLDALHPDRIDLTANLPVLQRIKLRQDGHLDDIPPKADEDTPPKPAVTVTVTDEDTPPKPAVTPPKPTATQPPAPTDDTTPPKPSPTVPPKPDDDTSGFSKEDKEFIASLNEEDRDSLEFWHFAERNDPTKHKGAFFKALDYFKDKRVQEKKITTEDADADLEQNDALNEWVKKNEPTLGRIEARNIQQRRVIETAKQELRDEQNVELDETRQRLNIMEKQPIVQDRYQKFNAVANDVIPKEFQDVMLKAQKDGKDPADALAASHGEENQVIGRHYQPLLRMGAELIQISEGTIKADSKNPLHVEINESIKRYGKMMLENPKMKDTLVAKDGRTFTPREQWNTMDATKRKQHWTLSDEQVLQVMVREAKGRAAKDLEEFRTKSHDNEVKILMSHGFKETDAKAKVAARRKVKPAPKPAAKPPKPAPGNSSTVKPDSTTDDDVSPRSTPSRDTGGPPKDDTTSPGTAELFVQTPMDSDNRPLGIK